LVTLIIGRRIGYHNRLRVGSAPIVAEQTAQQATERILVLNISMDGVEFSSDSTIHLKVTVRNTGTDPKVRVITATLQTALSEKTAILIHDIMELV
jgi:uncharacterized protein YPO0396